MFAEVTRVKSGISVCPGEYLESPIFPEPVRVFVVQPPGESLKIAARVGSWLLPGASGPAAACQLGSPLRGREP